MTPKLSVVVTCYQLGKYLGEALDSIPQRADVEVVVIDDGSTDLFTRQVLDGIDPSRATVVRQANMGLAKARNNGIRAARGAYIIPLDADNRLRPRFIERAIALLDADPRIGVVYGDRYDFEGREERRTVGPFDLSRLIRENHIDACACFRRTVWEAVGGYDEHMPVMGWEDWDLWLRCTVKGVEFHYEPEVFFDYRVRAGSMITDTRQHQERLVAYIFAKDELRFLRTLRERYIAARLRIEDEGRMLGGITTKALVRELLARLRGRTGRTRT